MTESLLKQVELTREAMIKSAIDNGFGNAKTIQLSKKLDQLLNIYQLPKALKHSKGKSVVLKN
ncbi:MAG: aspartyl-phosphate phosphatase Spo0E family protein [Paenisporosarcina sp.]